MDPEARVANHYDRDPDRELRRFERHPFEFPVTLHHIKRYLKPNSTLLDVGCGPGTYATALATLGHEVQLVDVSARLLELAKQQAVEAGVSFQKIHHGSATDLTTFASGSQDAVLCLGPMYHLVEHEDRDRAITECLRTLKPGGLLFIAFISVYAGLFDMIRNEPAQLVRRFEAVLGRITGPSVASMDEPGFTDAFFVQPDEVRDLMSHYHIEQLELLGVEGLTAQSERLISTIDDKVTDAWIRLAIESAHTPAALYGSDHLLFIGRKR